MHYKVFERVKIFKTAQIREKNKKGLDIIKINIPLLLCKAVSPTEYLNQII